MENNFTRNSIILLLVIIIPLAVIIGGQNKSDKIKESKQIGQEESYYTKMSNIAKDILAMSYLERENYISEHVEKDLTSEEVEKLIYVTMHVDDEAEIIKRLNDIKSVDYKKYEKMAKKGDNLAQFIIGNRYYKGLGVKKDFNKAFDYFSKASPTQRCAEVAMGNMYFKGEGVEKNIQKAIDLWTKDVDNEDDLDENSDDMVDCFHAILELDDLVTYPIEAYVLFEELAKQGAPENQTKLGEMYVAPHSGLLAHDLVWMYDTGKSRGIYWLTKAMKQNYREAYVGLSNFCLGYYGPSYCEDIYKMPFDTSELMDKAFDMGSIRIYNLIGDNNLYHYHVSFGVESTVYDRIGEEDHPSYPVNYKRALEYYSKTAEKGDPYGLYHVGLIYDGGYGVDKDPKKAMEYYQKAIANINFVSDMRPKRMGKMYQQFGERLLELGKTKEAKIVLNKSIELGNTKSKEILQKIK